MRIVNFAVNNFRGISGGLDQNRIDFNGINTLFIFGQNNSGKSTFLKAYDFFYRDAKPTDDDYHRKNSANTIELEIEVELDDWDKERIEAAAPQAKESYKDFLLEGRRLRLKNQWSKGKKEALTWNPLIEEYIDKGYASIGLHQVFQSCLPKPIQIKAMPTEAEGKMILNEILRDLAEARLKSEELAELRNARDTIRKLQESMYRPEVIKKYQESINQHLKDLFPSIRVAIGWQKERLAWTENKLGREHDLTFNSIDKEGKLEDDVPGAVDFIGHGTIRAAIFTLLLMRDVAEEFERIEGRKDYLVLFEEPELFLYPKIVRELRELIFKVSEGATPYQVLCASHSPSMIDLSKPQSSVVRLVREGAATRIRQISDTFLKAAAGAKTDAEFRQEMYEILRFNPYICESFYADHVILLEGSTEEILARAFLQELPSEQFLFILNCGTVTNIPFYQKILSRFAIPYSVICDTDDAHAAEHDAVGNPLFSSGIQRSISEQFQVDKALGNPGVLLCHQVTFEPAHRADSIPEHLRLGPATAHGKPYDANKYWKEALQPSIASEEIERVPIIAHLRRIRGLISD